jgi:drug/metabolite transporter (DMT)-like permease
MLYVILAILSSTSIFVLFKVFDKFFVNYFHAILINYFVAGLLGLLLFSQFAEIKKTYTSYWILWIIIIGILYFLNFLLIQKSTVKIGMATTSIACKVSVVIPVIFSIIYDKEFLSVFKILGIFGAVLSIILLTLKNNDQKEKNELSWFIVILPIILFLGLGVSDSMLKYVQQVYAFDLKTTSLTAFIFSVSFFTALLWSFFKKDFIKNILKLKTIIAGLLLGLFNFGSTYFLFMSLKYSKLDHSLVFGIINLSIILLSVFIGYSVYKEKLSKLNLIGVFTALSSLILMNLNE